MVALVTISGILLSSMGTSAVTANENGTLHIGADKLYVSDSVVNKRISTMVITSSVSDRIISVYLGVYGVQVTSTTYNLYAVLTNPVTSISITLTRSNLSNTTANGVAILSDNIRSVSSEWGTRNIGMGISAYADGGENIDEGGVLYSLPISVATGVTGGTTGIPPVLTGLGTFSVGSIVGDLVGSVSTLVLGADTTAAIGTVLGSMGQVMTMDFPGIPDILRLMIVVPLWAGMAYVFVQTLSWFIPLIGGGGSG